MLTAIVGVLSVVGSNKPAPQPLPTQPAIAASLTQEPEEVVLELSPAPTQAAAPRVSVSFNEDRSSSYALLKGIPPVPKRSHQPDIDVWYGEYSAQDYPVLPASPLEKEPSRLNVKISFAF